MKKVKQHDFGLEGTIALAKSDSIFPIILDL